MRPTIYCDTNSISVQFYRGSDRAVLVHRDATLDWWRLESRHFDVFALKMTEFELLQGVYAGQERAIRFVRKMRFLSRNRDVYGLAGLYLSNRLIPQGKQADAVHLAIATAHVMDYLMTWNYAHLANVDMQRKLHTINDAMGWRTPLIVTPETIPKVAYGQNIFRSDEK